MLDLAGILSPDALGRAIERAEQLGLFDFEAIDALLARTTSHKGAGPLRRALAAYETPTFTRSELERRFLRLVKQARLPRPSTNAFISGHELDMYWAPERFAVELDGYEYHRSRPAFERDRLRQEELKLAGIEMIRVTASRIAGEPERVMGHLSILLERRREELHRG
ncbi:MAG: DUF559 domain-containing protein [Solirubrobacterales bacterium]